MAILLFDLILADEVAYLPPPPVLASSSQEWQFYISTVRDESGRSTPLVLPCSGKEW